MKVTSCDKCHKPTQVLSCEIMGFEFCHGCAGLVQEHLNWFVGRATELRHQFLEEFAQRLFERGFINR